MSNTKPTPGNWRAIKMPQKIGYAEWQIAWSDDDELVADIVYTEADAKVMAASKDMLAALEGLFEGGLIEAGTREHSEWANELERRLVPCRAAIAKARGES